MNLRCAIIDDEPLAVSLLESYVQKTPFLELVGKYSNPLSAMAGIKSNPVDLLFLDIQMPDLDGMELAHMIPSETRIIFTTAFKEYAFESYEVKALDFLLKPIRYNKFMVAIDKAREWFTAQLGQVPTNNDQTSGPGPSAQSVFLKVDGEYRQVALPQILYVCGMKDYVMFYQEDVRKPLITHLTMKSVEDMLPPQQFMRVNRSYIVALDKIRKVDRNDCIYIGDEIIHVTDAFKESFNQFLQSKFPGGK